MKNLSDLKRELEKIDGRGYKTYKTLEGQYSFEDYILSIDHVQGDPFASPSRIRVIVNSNNNFPKNLFDEKGKIHLEKADLISYCHGEYFKMDTNPLGSFGYSVAKKKKALQSKSVKTKKDTPTVKSKSSKSKKSFNKKGR